MLTTALATAGLTQFSCSTCRLQAACSPVLSLASRSPAAHHPVVQKEGLGFPVLPVGVGAEALLEAACP